MPCINLTSMLKPHIKSKIYILHAVDPLRLIRVKELTKLGCKRGRRVLTVIKGSSESLMFSQTLGADGIYIRHLIGTLRSEDGDGRENVAEKANSRSFNLHRNYSKSLTLSNVGEPSKN